MRKVFIPQSCRWCHYFWPCDHSDEEVTGINTGGAETHQISCRHCRTVLRIESCTFVNRTCTVCGQTEPCRHTGATSISPNYNGTHSICCSDCGHVLDTVACDYGYWDTSEACVVCGIGR